MTGFEGSGVSQRLLASLEGHRDRWLSLIEVLVSIPSHASVPGGTDAVASHLLPYLEGIGFEIERILQEPLEPGMEWVEEIMMPGMHQTDLGPTYVARRSGSGPGLLILGDLDTSYPLDAHRAFPARFDAGRFYGPGVADMKAGLVVLLAALTALDECGLATPPLHVVLSGDEQAGSLGSSRVIRQEAESCPVTLCVECARRGGKLMAARGHIGIGELIATGREAHAGSSYEDGINAIDHLARVIPAVNALADPAVGVLVTVTMLEAGRRRSVIPDKARAILDVRTPSPEVWAATVGELQKVVSELGGGRVLVRTYCHRPGVQWTDATDDLLTRVTVEATPLGIEIGAFASAAAGSSAFAADAGSVVLDGMGPVGGGLMTMDEHVEVDSIAPRASLLAATIHALRGGG